MMEWDVDVSCTLILNKTEYFQDWEYSSDVDQKTEKASKGHDFTT